MRWPVVVFPLAGLLRMLFSARLQRQSGFFFGFVKQEVVFLCHVENMCWSELHIKRRSAFAGNRGEGQVYNLSHAWSQTTNTK